MPIVAAAVGFLGTAGGAAVASTAVGLGASIYGANKQADAAKDAANQSRLATDASLALQKQIYDQNRADQEPWRLAGQGALNQLADPNANFMASPDYQFRMQQGLEGVTQNRAVNGLLKSGSALRGLNDYAQNTAAGEFGSWWNRQAGLANAGQAANTQNAQSGSSYANASQNALSNNAQAQMQSSYYQGNVAAQGAGQVAGAIGWGIQNLPRGGSGAAGAGNPGAHAGGSGGGFSVSNPWRG